MATFEVKLKERKEVAHETMAFAFEKPAGFDFKPGQFVEVKIPNPAETDAEGNTRAFSLASAPHEPHLLVATRMRGTAMKRSLKNMELPAEVEIEGPYGNLTLHSRAERPAALIAGGIGITPFRSMVLDAAQRKLPHRIMLFYSNRRPEDAPFLSDLEAAQHTNPNFTLVATMTEMEKSSRPWRGRTGLLTRETIGEFVKDFAAPIYYLAGPPGMVGAMQKLLAGAGVNEDDIRAEEFAGY